MKLWAKIKLKKGGRKLETSCKTTERESTGRIVVREKERERRGCAVRKRERKYSV